MRKREDGREDEQMIQPPELSTHRYNLQRETTRGHGTLGASKKR